MQCLLLLLLLLIPPAKLERVKQVCSKPPMLGCSFRMPHQVGSNNGFINGSNRLLNVLASACRGNDRHGLQDQSKGGGMLAGALVLCFQPARCIGVLAYHNRDG